jgi:hypothetical protein
MRSCVSPQRAAADRRGRCASAAVVSVLTFVCSLPLLLVLPALFLVATRSQQRLRKRGDLGVHDPGRIAVEVDALGFGREVTQVSEARAVDARSGRHKARELRVIRPFLRAPLLALVLAGALALVTPSMAEMVNFKADLKAASEVIIWSLGHGFAALIGRGTTPRARRSPTRADISTNARSQ